MSSFQARLWLIISLALILAGLALLGVGGWMFYQYQLAASEPPPARILKVSVAEEAGTPVPELQEAAPAAVRPTGSAAGEAAVSPAATSFTSGSTTDTGETAPVNDSQEPSPAAPLPAALVELTATPQVTLTATSTAAAQEVLSLDNNPLPVETEMLTAAAAAEAPPNSTSPATSPPTRLVAETIGLDTSVMEVGWQQVTENGASTNVWLVADYAAGWHKNSALPGQGGNIVLSGHHNIKGEVFRYIIDLNIGDIVTLYVGEQPYQYLVVDKFIVKDKDEPEAVRRENAKWISFFNEERLTLVTCWPYTNNTHRAIVIARPVGVNP